MQLRIPALPTLILLLASLARADGAPPPRRSIDFDPDWRFQLGDSPMAMQSRFDDSAWRRLSVPHDWSIEGPFRAENASGNGFAPGGIGWYRKHFRMDPGDRGRVATLELDGVYDHAEVWLNGFLVGGRPSGYEPIACDLTPYLQFGGAENVLAVRVDHSRLADSRWYTGAGIYRHVRLRLTGALRLAAGGTYLTTPSVQAGAATVRVETAIENGAGPSRSFVLQSELLGPDGQVVAQSSAPGTATDGGDETMVQQLAIRQPALWSPETPVLYTLRSRLVVNGTVEDETGTPFGVRSLQFDPDRGFFLNGVATKFRGVCLHQDGGSVGVAVPLPVWERRLRELKLLGVNAIRTSHNPPAPEFLDLCDRLGFLVMDEAFDEYTPAKNKWVVGWNQGVPSRFGYSESFANWSERDLATMVRRDRNHPSVVMWSIGNEIDYPNDPFTDPALGASYRPGNPPAADLVRWGRPLVAVAKRLDPSRPVTAALASVAMSNAAGFAQILDLAGYNYQEPRYAGDHREFPRRVIYGSENKHDYAAWLAVRDNPMISGQFLWTGVDYLGEARSWPARANAAGLLDLAGFVKPLGRFRQSLWSSQPMVALAVGNEESWNWPDARPRTVSCFTNCAEVRLTLNGRPLGTKRLAEANEGVLRWEIPFAPGELKAVGRAEGRDACEFTLRTAGPASRIELTPTTPGLRADGQDVCQVEFSVVDAQGVRVPDAKPELTFALTGPGQILGLGNGDIANREPVRGPDHAAYQGRGLALVQSSPVPGPIVLTASAPGLAPATVTLDSR